MISEKTIRTMWFFHSLLFSEALPKHLRGKQKGHSCPAVHAGESSVPWMDRGRQSAGSLSSALLVGQTQFRESMRGSHSAAS